MWYVSQFVHFCSLFWCRMAIRQPQSSLEIIGIVKTGNTIKVRLDGRQLEVQAQCLLVVVGHSDLLGGTNLVTKQTQTK